MTEQTPLEGLYARESAPQGEDGELEGAGRERPSGGQQGPRGWTQLEARAFNAVLPALRQAGEWLPLSARRAVAQAVLAVVEPELRIAAALHELASGVRDLASSVRLESSDRARGEVSTDSERCCGCGSGPVVYRNFEDNPFCAHCANCPCGQIPCVRPEQQPAHNAGPTVAECAAADRRWPLEKHGE